LWLLVAEGKAEEATSIAEQQVESYLAKLLTDTSFRCVRSGCMLMVFAVRMPAHGIH
jgi:hypothetical protein